MLTISSVVVLAQSNVLQLNDVEANAGDQITVETVLDATESLGSMR
jgi:hypothetical protein